MCFIFAIQHIGRMSHFYLQYHLSKNQIKRHFFGKCSTETTKELFDFFISVYSVAPFFSPQISQARPEPGRVHRFRRFVRVIGVIRGFNCGNLERDPRYAGTQTGVHPTRCKHKCIAFYCRKGKYPASRLAPPADTAGKSALDPPKSIKGKKNDKKLYLPAGFDMLMPGTK